MPAQIAPVDQHHQQPRKARTPHHAQSIQTPAGFERSSANDEALEDAAEQEDDYVFRPFQELKLATSLGVDCQIHASFLFDSPLDLAIQREQVEGLFSWNSLNGI